MDDSLQDAALLQQRRTDFLALKTQKDLAALLGVTYEQLRGVLFAPPDKFTYETIRIRKKNGQFREISKPHPVLRNLQTRLLPFLEAVYRPKPSVHGFAIGRGIVTNARPHVRKRFVLNLDLENFFPSIHFGRVRGMLMAVPYRLPSAVAAGLARICCNKGVLPQGAPTSPIISNMICAKMDSEFQRLAARHRCTYSRYADDLTFSTSSKRFPEQLAVPRHGLLGENLHIGEQLIAIVTSNGFRLNVSKQRLQPAHHHQEVTGIVVNEFLNPRRRLVRQIRAMLHAWKKHGLLAASAEFRSKYDDRTRRKDKPAPSFIRVVLGKMGHIKNVGGSGHPGYRKLLKALHGVDPKRFEAPDEAQTWRPHMQNTASLEYWAERYRQSVFQLVIKLPDGSLKGGTAFMWDSEHLATAEHNLVGEISVLVDNVEVHIAPENQLRHPKCKAGVDAALLRVSPDVTSGRESFKSRETRVRVGEFLAALGYPTVPLYEPEQICRSGHIEGLASQYMSKITAIQVSIELTGGFSGGPVIDATGRLIGIVMESTFEQTHAGVPPGEFRHVLPTAYLREIPK